MPWIKCMYRIIREAVSLMIGASCVVLIIYVVGTLAVKWVTGRDFSDAFIFPEIVVLTFNQALSIVGVFALIIFCLIAVGKRIDEINEKLSSIDLSLEHLEPLVKEGRVIWEFEAEREADRYDAWNEESTDKDFNSTP